ncbi:MAG: ribonuclease R, partial [Thiopseudomonas sp.]
MKSDWQGHDPEAALEAQKYDNPIPSRTLILQHLAERGAPATREQLCAEFGLSSEDDIEAIRRRLRAMERDAQVVYTRRGAYAPVDKLDLVAGRVQGHRDGFGWLLPEGEGEDIFLSPVQMRSVFHGDRVLVRVTGLDKRGRKEGVIAEVVERARDTLVGRYNEENGLGFVIPDNVRMQHEIIISPGMAGGATVGQLVEVEITHWPTGRMPAQGRVARVLGDYMAPGMEIDVAIRNYDIPHEWPEAVLKEAGRFKDEVADKDKLKRVDLRELPFVTIDGVDARDFDDAVYCEPALGGWQLYVAIADVSHYVQVGSALDTEAAKRGNSVYFPERVIPMLPVELSNGLCSLNPDVDRLAMVCRVQLSRNGKMQDYCFFEAVIRSHARLTYDEVSDILEHPDSAEGKAAIKTRKALVPHLQQLYALYQALARQRHQRGAIDFETRETYIVFGEDRKIAEILPTERNDAHRLIEECMLSANVAMADFLHSHKLPGLYRIHDGPPEAKLEKLQGFLATLGLSINKGRQPPTPKDYLRLLEQIRERPDFDLIQTVMLRSLSQAVYSPEDIGHFGLNYDSYTHFTSPIRRYADLLNHRAVRSIIRSRRQSP